VEGQQTRTLDPHQGSHLTICDHLSKLRFAMKDWAQSTSEISALMRTLRSDAPDVMKAFAGIAQAATAPHALDGKTKELIALGIAVATRCDDCIGFHVKAALRQGATREEIVETLGMAIYMGAGPSVMYATHALEAFGQFSKQEAAAPVAAT
jgi:AhpD family alkylhydroperoxidase